MSKTETKQKDIICPECGAGPFKSPSGLAGHRQLAHNVEVKIIGKDEITKRLESLEGMAVAANPGQRVDTEEGLVTTLKLLLPAMQKFDLVILPFGSRYDDDYLEFKRYRIIKNPDFSKAGFGGLVVGTDAEEL